MVVAKPPLVIFAVATASIGLVGYAVYAHRAASEGCTKRVECEAKASSGQRSVKGKKKSRSAAPSKAAESDSKSASVTVSGEGEPPLAKSSSNACETTRGECRQEKLNGTELNRINQVVAMAQSVPPGDIAIQPGTKIVSVPPGDITTEPGTKIVFNGPYDDKIVHTNSGPNSVKSKKESSASPSKAAEAPVSEEEQPPPAESPQRMSTASTLVTSSATPETRESTMVQDTSPTAAHRTEDWEAASAPRTQLVPIACEAPIPTRSECGQEKLTRTESNRIDQVVDVAQSVPPGDIATQPGTKIVSVPPGDITTEPGTKIVFNGPYDDMHTYHIKVINFSAHRIGWAFKTNNMKRFGVDPASGVLDPKEAALVAVSCDAFDYELEDTSKDRVTVEWTNTPDGAAKQFRRAWFQGDSMTRRRKNLPIEYNP